MLHQGSERSVPFYRDIRHDALDHYDFPPMKFSLYFMGCPCERRSIPTDPARAKWVLSARRYSN
jgi:hypothetical protein